MIRLVLAFVAAPFLASLLGDLASAMWVDHPSVPRPQFRVRAFWVYGTMLAMSLPGLVLLFWRGGGRCRHLIAWGGAASSVVLLLQHQYWASTPAASLCFVALVGPVMGAALWFIAFFENEALAGYLPEPGERLERMRRSWVDVVIALMAAATCIPSLRWMFAGESPPGDTYAAFVMCVLFLPVVIIYLMGPWRRFQTAGTLGLGALQLLEFATEITITSQLEHEGSDMAFMMLRVLVAFFGLFVLVFVLAGQRAACRKTKGGASSQEGDAQRGRTS